MARIARFYKHESCGQCTPCREGSGWMWRMLERMAKGEASKDEIDMLGDVTKQIEGPSICFVTSPNMSISSLDASPFAILSSILHIQPEPSLQGVHWPQLSCL